MLPRAFRRRRLTVVAVALLAATLLVAVLVRTDPLSPPFQGLDDAWLRLMAGPRDGLLWGLAEAFNHGGSTRGLLLVFLPAVVLLAARRWWSALFAVTAVSLTYVVVDLLKLVGDRPRPEEVLVDVVTDAFPSGHAARMASIVLVATVIAIPVGARWWWPVAVALVLGMMWSRTWQYAHWLTDTVGGAATGLGVSLLCWRAFDPLLERERRRRAQWAEASEAE
ncbi:hypothetical protein GCM10027447_34470 [Glycomyces halotolerans]